LPTPAVNISSISDQHPQTPESPWSNPERTSGRQPASAVRAARTVGLNVSGVDLLQSNHGPVVMEVNSSPGLEGVEGATNVDVAGKIIEFLENHAAPNKTRDRVKG